MGDGERPVRIFSRFHPAVWRAALSVAIFGIAFSQIDPRAFGFALAGSRPTALALGFLSALIGVLFLRAVKFWLILRLQGLQISGPHVLWLASVSQFFGFALPGTLGSDAWRIYYLSQRSHRAGFAIVAVVMDRVSGFVGQMMTILLASVFLGGAILEVDLLAAMAVWSGVALAATACLGSRKIVRSLGRLPLLRRPRVSHHLSEIQEGFSLFRRLPLGSLGVLFLATLGQSFWALSIFVVGRDLGVSFLYFWFFVPLADGVAALPITLSGLGLRDVAYVTFFGSLGVPPESMLALSVTALGFLILIRLLGGLTYLIPVPFHERDLRFVSEPTQTTASS